MYQQHQTRSNNPSTGRNFSLPEPSAPIKPLPQLLARDRLNVIGEYHDISDKRRDVEKQFCYEQTGSREYFTEAAFKATDYTPKHDHHGRELPDRPDGISPSILDKDAHRPLHHGRKLPDRPAGADPMKLRMIQYICIILEELMNVKCAIEEQDLDISFNVISKELNENLEILRLSYLDTFIGLDGFEFKDSQTKEALMKLGSKIEAIEKSSTNISNILESSKLNLEQLNTLFPAVKQAVTEALEVKKLLCKDSPEIPDDDFNWSSDSMCLTAIYRSEAMHEAAQRRAKTAKGQTWKIGEDHREHMMVNNKRDYNLVSEAKFDDALKQWQLGREQQRQQQQLEQQRKEQQFQEDFDNFVDPSAYSPTSP